MKWTVTKIKCGGGVVSESCVVYSRYPGVLEENNGKLVLIFFDNNII